jgi:hypothetical protein
MKSVEDYMNLPYNCIVQQINDESGTYFYAHVLELDGCQSTGETFKEAYESLKEVGLKLKLMMDLMYHYR